MTRVNLTKPQELYYKFLVAEYKEIVRIFSQVEKHGINISKIPKEFKLNSGHILFFTNKLKFIFERYCLLHHEMQRRGYKTNYTISSLYLRYSHLLVDKQQINYIPTIKDIEISQERLNQKLLKLVIKEVL